MSSKDRAPALHAAAHRLRLRKCRTSHITPMSRGNAVGKNKGTYTANVNSGGKYISALNFGS